MNRQQHAEQDAMARRFLADWGSDWLTAYALYLADALDPRDRAELARRLAEGEPQIATLANLGMPEEDQKKFLDSMSPDAIEGTAETLAEALPAAERRRLIIELARL